MAVYKMKTMALALLLSRDASRVDAAMFGERALGEAASRLGRGILVNQERRELHHPTYTHHPDGAGALPAPFGHHPLYTPLNHSMQLPTQSFQRGFLHAVKSRPQWWNHAVEARAQWGNNAVELRPQIIPATKPAENWTRMPGTATMFRIGNESEKTRTAEAMNKKMALGGTWSGFHSNARDNKNQGDVPGHFDVQEVKFLRNAENEAAYEDFVGRLTSKISRERSDDVDMGDANEQNVPFTAATLPVHGPGAANPANEFVLYHGCSLAVAEAISKGNFDLSKGDMGALFGPGVYMTDSVTKADEFAVGPRGDLGGDWDAPRYMLLVKVVLGKSKKFTTDGKDGNFEETETQNALQTPPHTVVKMGQINDNMEESELKNALAKQDWAVKRFQSIMGDKSHVSDANGNMAHREWIVYNNQQVVPFAVITYRRGKGRVSE